MIAHEACDEIAELIPAYAVGALSAVEREQVELHVPQCPGCHALLADYQEVADGLAHCVPVVPVPARVREQLSARLAAETRTLSASSTRAPASVPVAEPRPSSRRRWNLLLHPAWAVAVIALTLLAYVWMENAGLRQEMQELRGQYRWLVVMLTDPNSQHYMMVSEQGKARFIMRPGDPRGVLIAEQLPELEPGKEYQLWLVHANGKRDNGGTFRVREGRGWLIVDPPAPWEVYRAVGVTIEPEGGSPDPTGPRVVGTEM